MGNEKWEGRRNVKATWRCNIFMLIFLLLVMMVTNTVFRESSLENLF